MATSTSTQQLLYNFFQIQEDDPLPNYICVDCWIVIKKFHEFYKNVLSAQKEFLLDGKVAVKTETSIEIFDGETESNVEYQEGDVFHEELKIYGNENETSNFDMHDENTVDDFVDDSDPDLQDSDQSESGKTFIVL